MNGELVGLVTAVMGILCGIIGIISGTISSIKKRNYEMRIRESIIENHVDAETAKVLVTPESQKKNDPYATLRWGLALLGIGAGYLVAWYLNLNKDFGWLVLMAAGCGVGLLVSFFVSLRMEQRKRIPFQSRTGKTNKPGKPWEKKRSLSR